MSPETVNDLQGKLSAGNFTPISFTNAQYESTLIYSHANNFPVLPGPHALN